MADSSNQRSRDVFLLLVDRAFSLASLVVKGVVVTVVAWRAEVAVGHLAGKSTAVWAQIFAYISTPSQGLVQSASMGLALLCMIWALVERRLRYRQIGRFEDRIRMLEQGRDPRRTSAGLTPDGRTNPQDM